MKGADMITPIGTLNINQIAERKDDLLMSDDDIKELAKNVRAKAIDEFTKEIVAEYDNDACPNVTDYLDYKISIRDLHKIADQLKGGAV